MVSSLVASRPIRKLVLFDVDNTLTLPRQVRPPVLCSACRCEIVTRKSPANCSIFSVPSGRKLLSDLLVDPISRRLLSDCHWMETTVSTVAIFFHHLSIYNLPLSFE